MLTSLYEHQSQYNVWKYERLTVDQQAAVGRLVIQATVPPPNCSYAVTVPLTVTMP